MSERPPLQGLPFHHYASKCNAEGALVRPLDHWWEYPETIVRFIDSGTLEGGRHYEITNHWRFTAQGGVRAIVRWVRGEPPEVLCLIIESNPSITGVGGQRFSDVDLKAETSLLWRPLQGETGE